jgi:hypothetical protein
VGLRASLDRCRIPHPHRDLIPQPASSQSVAIVTSLSQIMYQDLNNGHIPILLRSFTDTMLDSAKYFSTYQHNLVLLSEREHRPSNIKVKQSHNRPGVAQRVPGGLGSQIS